MTCCYSRVASGKVSLAPRHPRFRGPFGPGRTSPSGSSVPLARLRLGMWLLPSGIGTRRLAPTAAVWTGALLPFCPAVGPRALTLGRRTRRRLRQPIPSLVTPPLPQLGERSDSASGSSKGCFAALLPASGSGPQAEREVPPSRSVCFFAGTFVRLELAMSRKNLPEERARTGCHRRARCVSSREAPGGSAAGSALPGRGANFYFSAARWDAARSLGDFFGRAAIRSASGKSRIAACACLSV